MKIVPQVILVGPLPPPIGGVSTHIAGLANLLKDHEIRCAVLDAYPASDEKASGQTIEHILYVGPLRFLRMLWFLSSKSVANREIIHLHFSHITGKFLVFSFLPKRGRKLFLTLHNGGQAANYLRMPRLLRLLLALAVRQADKVIALSRQQEEFYLSLGMPSSQIDYWNMAPLPAVVPDDSELPPEIQEMWPVENGGEETIFLASGYPDETYGFDDCMDLLNSVSSRYPCKLVVCLYGRASDPIYERKLRERCRTDPRILLVGPLPAAGFAALLFRASLYVRPSRVDSFGLAITEALNLGIPSLASDVCGRDPRCTIFPVGNMDAFVEKALEIVELGRRARKRTRVAAADTSYVSSILAAYGKGPDNAEKLRPDRHETAEHPAQEN